MLVEKCIGRFEKGREVVVTTVKVEHKKPARNRITCSDCGVSSCNRVVMIMHMLEKHPPSGMSSRKCICGYEGSVAMHLLTIEEDIGEHIDRNTMLALERELIG